MDFSNDTLQAYVNYCKLLWVLQVVMHNTYTSYNKMIIKFSHIFVTKLHHVNVAMVTCLLNHC